MAKNQGGQGQGGGPPEATPEDASKAADSAAKETKSGGSAPEDAKADAEIRQMVEALGDGVGEPFSRAMQADPEAVRTFGAPAGLGVMGSLLVRRAIQMLVAAYGPELLRWISQYSIHDILRRGLEERAPEAWARIEAVFRWLDPDHDDAPPAVKFALGRGPAPEPDPGQFSGPAQWQGGQESPFQGGQVPMTGAQGQPVPSGYFGGYQANIQGHQGYQSAYPAHFQGQGQVPPTMMGGPTPAAPQYQAPGQPMPDLPYNPYGRSAPGYGQEMPSVFRGQDSPGQGGYDPRFPAQNQFGQPLPIGGGMPYGFQGQPQGQGYPQGYPGGHAGSPGPNTGYPAFRPIGQAEAQQAARPAPPVPPGDSDPAASGEPKGQGQGSK